MKKVLLSDWFEFMFEVDYNEWELNEDERF